MSQDAEYYRERAATERKLAKAASQAEVAAIHNDLADRYDVLAKKAEPRAKPRVAAAKRTSRPA